MNSDDKPWEHEPDHLMFMSDAGYVCEIKRHEVYGHLNGYIYIPAGHPDFGKTYNDLHGYGDGGMYEDAPDVHGGWTFSDTRGEVTVFGFDCNHADDFAPKMGMGTTSAQFNNPVNYKTIEFVVNQLEHAAKQFKERESS